MTTAGVPYWRLSGFYLFYFASIGAFIPYWSLYLKDLGFSGAEIGELMAILMGTKIVAPNLWGWIADHLGQRVRIIRLATFAAALVFGGVLFTTGFWGLAAIMAGFSFFWHAALPQFEATTMTHLGPQTHRYSRIRLWGSIGFIVSVMALAPLFEVRGIGLLPVVVWVLLGGIWLNTLVVPEGRDETEGQTGVSLRRALSQPVVLALLAACFFMQASHGPYYTFFSIHLEEEGYSRSVVGQLWALGVLAEVVVFLFIHRWLARIGPARLLTVAVAVTALRWAIIGELADSPIAVILAQLMHAASYGVYHAAAIELVHGLFPGRLRGRGQALYSSVSFGLGGALGSLYSGYLWDQTGAAWTYLSATGIALLGVVCALYVQRHTTRTASV